MLPAFGSLPRAERWLVHELHCCHAPAHPGCLLQVTLRPTLERPTPRFLPTTQAQPDRIRAPASGGDAVVDVNVTPARTERGTWILSDLLRRPVGQIAQILDGGVRHPPNPGLQAVRD